MYEHVLSPIQYGNVTIKNRFVMSPMAIHITETGFVTPAEVEYFARRAEGGFGMIIVGSLLIKKDGDFGFQIYIDNDDKIEGLKQLTDAIHARGAKACAQIHHAGRATNPRITGLPTVSSSEMPATPEYPVPRALSTEEVGEYVEYYAQAIRRAKEAGFDCCELHGGHGYLIAQFVSPLFNKRTDRYGGSFLKRMTFPTEILQRARELVGPDFSIGIRMSGDELTVGGIDMPLAERIAKYYERIGFCAISVSVHTYPYYRIIPSSVYKPGVNVYLAENIKQAVNIPVITAGRINNADLAESIIASGKADLIALGRASLADPDFPKKIMEGRPQDIITCMACNKGCHDRKLKDRSVKCTLNPETGRELFFRLEGNRAETPKKVMVVGGGPAGMEAARVLDKRGHDVSLYEATDKLGGRMLLAAIPPGKSGYQDGVDYLSRCVENSTVKIYKNTPVTKALIEQEKPDAIVLATGALPVMPPIPGVKQDYVFDADQILRGEAKAGNRAFIIGGGAVGSETAHFLVEETVREVYVAEMTDAIGKDMPTEIRSQFMHEIESISDMHVLTNTKVLSIGDHSVTVEEAGKTYTVENIDTVIIAVGVKAHNPLEETVKELGIPYHLIGDAERPQDCVKAIYEGSVAGREI